MTIPCFIIGQQYNWKHEQSPVLIYLGKKGVWNQFAYVEQPNEVWCEVLDGIVDASPETGDVHGSEL